MPKLSPEKEEAIVRAFLELGEYKAAGDKENVSPRTVSNVVKRWRTDGRLARLSALITGRQNIGQDVMAIPVGKSELDLQLSANELFEKGYTNILVSKELRLLPNQVLQFRKAYNELVKSDIDDEIGKRVAQKKALESTIQQQEARVMQSEKILKEKRDERERILQEIHNSKVRIVSLKDEITLLNAEKEKLFRKMDTVLRVLNRYKAKIPDPEPWWKRPRQRSGLKSSLSRSKTPRKPSGQVRTLST